MPEPGTIPIARVQEVPPELAKFSAGELSSEQTVKLFQKMVNTGVVWLLGEHYAEIALELLDKGHLYLPAQYDK